MRFDAFHSPVAFEKKQGRERDRDVTAFPWIAALSSKRPAVYIS
jgi:hypothetical protein